jgi:PRC-barrel domain
MPVRGGYRSGEARALPYYGLSGGGVGIGEMRGGSFGAPRHSEPIVSDSVPLGEVEVRRGDEVRASDGKIGTVQGFVIDPRNSHVTHVLLQEGHLWGRRQIAIPIGAVTRGPGVIQLTLSKREVNDLPQIEVNSEN